MPIQMIKIQKLFWKGIINPIKLKAKNWKYKNQMSNNRSSIKIW
jgi:hypothetical protein